jgi:hypothetical protein
MSMVNSTNPSFVPYDHKKQSLFTKINRPDRLQSSQIHLMLLKPYHDDALSYLEVCYWHRQFLTGRDYIEDAGKAGQIPIYALSFEFRMRSRRCHLSLFDALPRPRTLLQQRRFRFDGSTPPEIPSLAMGAALALRRSKVDSADMHLCFWPP